MTEIEKKRKKARKIELGIMLANVVFFYIMSQCGDVFKLIGMVISAAVVIGVINYDVKLKKRTEQSDEKEKETW